MKTKIALAALALAFGALAAPGTASAATSDYPCGITPINSGDLYKHCGTPRNFLLEQLSQPDETHCLKDQDRLLVPPGGKLTKLGFC